MTASKHLIYILFLNALFFNKVFGQGTNLAGDTIFASSDEELQIKFPSDRIEYRWTSLNPPYSVSLGPNSLFVHAKNDSAKCSNLSVFEGPGPRNHNLVFCYQKQISKIIYDYSTTKKLQQRVKEIQDRENQKIAAEKEPGEATTNQPVSENHYKILEDGDNALKNGQLDEAQALFEKVLKIQPDNEFALRKLVILKDKRAEVSRKRIDSLKSSAIKAFSERRYDDAERDYNQIISLDANNLFAKSQVDLIKRIKAEEATKAQLERDKIAQREMDDKIEALKKEAAKAYEEKRYDDAIAAYERALELRPADVGLIKRKIDEIKKLKNQLAQEAETDEKFKNLVAAADKAFENKEYEVAYEEYRTAKTLKPNDTSLEQKLAVTNEKITISRKEEQYNSAVSEGDKAMKSGQYDKAKAQFKKALEIFPDKADAQDKIEEIDKMTSEITARQKEKEKELETINKYNAAIEKADKALINKDYSTAKLFYNEASKLKPDEEYPKSKLSDITSLLNNIAKMSEINKQYALALAKGKAAITRKDYDVAKSAYLEASKLKPEEEEPKVKLEFIARQWDAAALNARYDSAMAQGNVALADNDLASALQYFREALKLKPLEKLPLSQISYTRQLLTADAVKQRQAITKAQEEIRKKRFREGMYEYSKYERAAQITDYEEELRCLKNFLNIVPDLGLDDYSYSQKIEDSKRKIQTIRDHLSKTKGARYQCEAIPYLDRELESKYENVNFTAPPEGQTFEKLDSNQRAEVEKLSQDELKEKGHSIAEDSSNNLKVTCQGISFKGDKVFYKFLIQNTDSTEFLTGAMQISSFMKSDLKAKINPFYISSFPIILPGKEFAVVYAAKDMEVDDDGSVTFDLNDRLKNKRAHISIPGKVYNEEKKQKM